MKNNLEFLDMLAILSFIMQVKNINKTVAYRSEIFKELHKIQNDISKLEQKINLLNKGEA